MCRFCVEHGEGERWYLQAANYASDLESDLRRRDYIVSFVRDFDRNRSRAIAAMDVLDRLPGPVARFGKARISRRMQDHHFGQPVPIEDCERIFSIATSITVIPCICRMHAPGMSAEEVCVLVTTQPIEPVLTEGFSDYANGPDLSDFRTVTAAEAMDLLRECEHRGLMHSVWTFQTPFTAAICNCNLESGCMAMRLTAGYKMPLMWRGEYVAVFDEDRCSSCGRCARVCPFDAVDMRGGLARQRLADCWGCGICRAACPHDAITLVDRRRIPQVATLW